MVAKFGTMIICKGETERKNACNGNKRDVCTRYVIDTLLLELERCYSN
jgi:hypothetical protein